MEVILREDVDKLGRRGEVVKVAEGYGRNFLLPRGPGHAGERGQQGHDRQGAQGARGCAWPRRRRSSRPWPTASPRLRFIAPRKVGENDVLYGSVTSGDIADFLKGEGRRDRQAQGPARGADQEARRARGRRSSSTPRCRRRCKRAGHQGRLIPLAPQGGASFALAPRSGASSAVRFRCPLSVSLSVSGCPFRRDFPVPFRPPPLISSEPWPPRPPRGERTLPHNAEAERTVLGAVLVDNQAFNSAAEILTRNDFYREAHRRIFDAMAALAERSQPIDLVTLKDELVAQARRWRRWAAPPTWPRSSTACRASRTSSTGAGSSRRRPSSGT